MIAVYLLSTLIYRLLIIHISDAFQLINLIICLFWNRLDRSLKIYNSLIVIGRNCIIELTNWVSNSLRKIVDSLHWSVKKWSPLTLMDWWHVTILWMMRQITEYLFWFFLLSFLTCDVLISSFLRNFNIQIANLIHLYLRIELFCFAVNPSFLRVISNCSFWVDEDLIPFL